MYKTVNVVCKIKEEAKRKGYKISEILSACGLSTNTLSSMSTRGSWIQANSLAKIADYLDCSVDYLLGRTSNPEFHKNALPYEKKNIVDKLQTMIVQLEELKNSIDN